MKTFLIIIVTILVNIKLYSSNTNLINHKDTLSRVALVGNNDSIIFALSNATLTASYIDIPVLIKSDEIINAVDFAFKFDETKLTYDTIFNLKSYLSALANFNTFDRYLRFTSSSLQTIDTSVVLIKIRFTLNIPCAQINSNDFNSIEAYLNGDPSKYIVSSSSQVFPNANFNNGNLCSNSSIQFTDISTVAGGTITSWNWDFGNGLNSSLQNPISTYSTTGTYTASLVITANTGCTDTITKQLIISSSPISSFSYTLDCLKDSVYFTNLSSVPSGTILNSSWNFGDLGTSNIYNPSHHYNAGGSYNVTLISTSNLSCTNTTTATIVLNKPIANFTTTSINNCLGSVLNFSNTSAYASGVITSWNWDFGDGNTSNVQHPSHIYTVAGSYTVTLISLSSLGCSGTISQTININGNPIVQFGANNLVGCSTQTVSFLSSSTPTVGSLYAWNFGDGTTSTIQNPTHIYPTVGTYTVKLIVTTTNGCIDSLVKPSYITIYNSPTTNFSATNGCVNSITSFTNSSTIPSGTITSWSWDFGNSITSGLQSPIYSYTNPGSYTVNLITTSNNGCKDSLSKMITIYPKPLVQFNANNTSGCGPLTLNFNDLSSTQVGSTYLWNFGDNTTSSQQNPVHTYSLAGNYTVKLYVTNTSGCSDSLIKTSYINVNPSPTANFSVTGSCINSTSNFTDNSTGIITSWNWNFGDGNSSSTQSPSHVYSNAGNFTVTLSAINSAGCSSLITKTITINSKPIVQFSADTLAGCAPQLINFMDLSTTAIGSSYLWHFGDNVNSFLQNPSHTYSVVGSYSVKLIVTTIGGCSDSLVKTNYISVVGPPVALFSVSNTTINLPNAIASFSNTSLNYNNVVWNFGDSQSSTSNSINHAFINEGTYQVCLTAYNTTACSNTYCNDIIVNSSNMVAIPSAFTPNNDNTNDVLKVKGGPFLEMEFNIFNEWGNLLFSSSSQNDGWNGKFKGDDQPTGLYEYTLKGTTIENEIINLYGVVNLIR